MSSKKKRILIFLYILGGFVLVLIAISYVYYVPGIPAEILNEKYGVTAKQYIEVDGMDVHFRVDGLANDSVPLVLLHGTASSLYTWNAWVELLHDKHKIIRLDLPGFGLTGPHPEGDYRVEAYMNLLNSFLSKLKVKRCILVGNSLGGEIAWRYAADHPQQLKKLILIGASGYPVDIKELPLLQIPPWYIWLSIPLIREVTVMFTTPGVIRRSLAYLYYGDAENLNEETVQLYFDMTNRQGNREALTERVKIVDRPAPIQKIPSIHTPTLILWGEHDRLIPVKHARQFQEDLPDSQLVIFPRAGHMPQEEIPLASAEAAIQWLSRRD
ncbi:MAG: alpha/beta fold hydrolase [Cyclobacteriaceae bacterium]